MSICGGSCADRRSHPNQATSKFSWRAVFKDSRGILCTALPCRVPITSIAMQNEENKALFPSPLVGENGAAPDEGSLSAETDPTPAFAFPRHPLPTRGEGKERRPRGKTGA